MFGICLESFNVHFVEEKKNLSNMNYQMLP